MGRKSQVNSAALAPGMAMACDGTALGLIHGVADTVPEVDPDTRMAEPEEIDTEDDDAEFDDRAHWGRRRGKTLGSKKKQPIEDKMQPKINLFYVAQGRATQESEQAVENHATDTEAVESLLIQEDNDGNGGSTVEVYVQSASQSMTIETLSSQLPEASPSPSPLPLPPPQSSDLTPSGRPKRQAVLRAEQAARRDAEASQSLFLTPPAIEQPKKSVGDSEGDNIASSSGRKRKLEMAVEKKKTTNGGGSAPAPAKGRPPSSVFFLSDREKQELIANEAVESFKEQLRQQRERDLAFYGDREVKNPFFQARLGSSAQKAFEIDASDDTSSQVIDLCSTPDPSPAKSAKSKWSKDVPSFPNFQHCLVQDEAVSWCSTATLSLPRKNLVEGSEEIIVLDEDDEAVDAPWTAEDAGDNVHSELALDDAFWLLSTANAEPLDSLASCTREEAIERVAETYTIKEKRVRKTLTALESARAKRLEKAPNLSLVDLYTPVAIHGMMGNKSTLKKLSAWLGAWKTGGDIRDRHYDSELFAFEGDDSDEDEDGSQLLKVFVLEGEVGSGKSAAVYACAEELGYEIIEINAGQLRTGKAVVDIAGEATQSTRVLHSAGSLGDKGSKKKKSKKQRRSERDRARPSHLSLVLFEDVDLVFDEDKGFLSTLGSIAKHSKCPIAVTCRRRPDGFPSSPPSIVETLVRPSQGDFMAWLSLVAFLEQVPLTQELAARLAHMYECDIRRSLHLLQAYRPQIQHESRLCQSLAWSSSPPGTQQESYGSTRTAGVPAWSRSVLRSFDLLECNFLPLLDGTMCASYPRDNSTKSAEVLQQEYSSLGRVFAVLEAVSLGDEWETSSERSIAEDGDVFSMDFVRHQSLDLRMLSLRALSTGTEDERTQLSIADCSLSDGIVRVLQASRLANHRCLKSTRLAALKSKLDLPVVAKGSARVGALFSSDYLPMVARILECSEPMQESRRRASRRHHYLREVLSDMSVIDDIVEFHSYAIPPQQDEIVPSSADAESETVV